MALNANQKGVFKEQLGGVANDYQIEELLGKGSFGEVYKVSKNNKNWAIKILDKKKILNLKILKYVESEVKIMQQINSENCLKLIDFFENSNFYFMVLEYCKDGNLLQYIKEKQPDENECLKIFVQILRGFKEIHSLNYLHRDIKPENILIHEGKFKIADFGFATTSEIGKTYCGTSYYMSPEILQHKLHDHKTDLWSLAVLLFQMIFRQVPFNCKTNRLQQIQTMCTPYFDLPKVLHEKQITIQYSQDLCDLFKNIFVFNNLERYNFSYLYYHCKIIKRYLSQTFIQKSTQMYSGLEQSDLKAVCTGMLSDSLEKVEEVDELTPSNRQKKQQNQEQNNIKYDDEGEEEEDESLYYVQDEGHILKYNNLMKSQQGSQQEQSQIDLSDNQIKKFGPRKFQIQQCTLILNQLPDNNDDQQLNQVEKEILRVKTQQSHKNLDENQENNNNNFKESDQTHTQQDENNKDQYDDQSIIMKKEKTLNKNLMTQDSSMMLKINNLMGPSNSVMFNDINIELEFKNCIDTYEYYIARYNFICDIIQLIPSLYLNQQDCNLCSFALCKQMLFFAQQLQNSLKNQENLYKLENFEQFIQTPKKDKIISQIQLDIDSYTKKLQMFYYGLDHEKVLKNQQIKSIISDKVTETDFDKELKIPIRCILNPIYKFSRDKGELKHDEEYEQEHQQEEEDGLDDNQLDNLMEKNKNKVAKKSVHDIVQQVPYHKRRKTTNKLQMNSYSYLIPALGILLCMVINTIFDQSDKLQVFEYFYKENEILKIKKQFDFWKFFYWMERTESINLIDQMDHILLCAFGIKKQRNDSETKTQGYRKRQQSNYKNSHFQKEQQQ